MPITNPSCSSWPFVTVCNTRNSRSLRSSIGNFQVFPTWTNESFADKVCSFVAYAGLEINVAYEMDPNIRFLLPECAYASTTWSFLRIDGNVIIQGNATFPNPLDRFAFSPLVTQLMLTGVRFVDPTRSYANGLYPYTINWTSFNAKYPLLKQLTLDSTQLMGTLPSSLPSLLTIVSVMNNSLTGTISPTLFANLPYYGALTFLASDNALTGSIPREMFGGFTRVGSLQVSFANNKLNGTIPTGMLNITEAGPWDLSFQGNALTGTIPADLFEHFYAPSSSFDFSSNKLTGSISSDLFVPLYPTLSSGVTLNVSRNQIDGTIPDLFTGIETSIIGGIRLTIDASRNRISGTLPSTFSPPPTIDSPNFYFDYGYNALTGTIPDTLLFHGYYNVSNYGSSVYLDHNQLTGTLPDQFVLSNVSHASVGIKLGGNLLTGTLPAGLLTDMATGGSLFLDLSLNGFTGTIPNDLLLPFTIGPSEVLSFNVSHNKLTGPLPNHIRDGVSQAVVDLSYNKLSGSINSTALFAVPDNGLYFIFNASNNQLEGTISLPTSVIIPGLRNAFFLYLSNNRLTSLEFAENAVDLRALDISGNTKLTGTIPPVIFNSTASYLGVFLASHTALTGAFPNIISNITVPIARLDLSYTAIQFCKKVSGDPSFWLNTQLFSCNLAFTTAHSCPGKYPSICDTRFTSSSTILAPVSLFGFVLVLLAFVLFA